MKILITNDDGIHSYFLKVLVEAFIDVHATVTVAAPAGEKSWIGRAVSRNETISVEKSDFHPCPAWAITGTPTDCVNIALAHLLPEKPDVVVSGINLGFNVGVPFVLSSGTVGGATEGAMWGIPSLALSLQLEASVYEKIRQSVGHAVDDQTLLSLKSAVNHSVRIAQELAGKKTESVQVTNINFPIITRDDTETIETRLAQFRLGSLFHRDEDGKFRFRFSSKDTPLPQEPGSDTAALITGKISRSTLDFGRI